mmetsp:Transcript_12853/g.30663  ORF Transcript_12853/g.30663 Transcript_12853/m.30663 type:complete len:311 (-) Transcript_12853:835-1767(-)
MHRHSRTTCQDRNSSHLSLRWNRAGRRNARHVDAEDPTSEMKMLKLGTATDTMPVSTTRDARSRLPFHEHVPTSRWSLQSVSSRISKTGTSMMGYVRKRPRLSAPLTSTEITLCGRLCVTISSVSLPNAQYPKRPKEMKRVVTSSMLRDHSFLKCCLSFMLFSIGRTIPMPSKQYRPTPKKNGSVEDLAMATAGGAFRTATSRCKSKKYTTPKPKRLVASASRDDHARWRMSRSQHRRTSSGRQYMTISPKDTKWNTFARFSPMKMRYAMQKPVCVMTRNTSTTTEPVLPKACHPISPYVLMFLCRSFIR